MTTEPEKPAAESPYLKILGAVNDIKCEAQDIHELIEMVQLCAHLDEKADDTTYYAGAFRHIVFCLNKHYEVIMENASTAYDIALAELRPGGVS